MGQREAIKSVMGVLLTANRPEIRKDSFRIPSLPFEGARIERERITKQGDRRFRCRHKAQADSDRVQSASFRMSQKKTDSRGAERLDRSSEVVNEALAAPIQRSEQWKKTHCMSYNRGISTKFPASTSHETRENPTEPDPDPKKMLLMKSASSTAIAAVGSKV